MKVYDVEITVEIVTNYIVEARNKKEAKKEALKELVGEYDIIGDPKMEVWEEIGAGYDE